MRKVARFPFLVFNSGNQNVFSYVLNSTDLSFVVKAKKYYIHFYRLNPVR